MKRIAAVLVGLLWLSNSCFAGGKIDLNLTMQMGKVLDVDLKGVEGSLSIEGWSKEKVTIQGNVRGRDCSLSIDERTRGVSISPDCGSSSERERLRVNLTIRVPRQCSIRLRAATETTIASVEGHMEVEVANDDLRLIGVKGEADISTANGYLTIKGSELEGSVSNVNGRLRLSTSTINGKVSSVNSSQNISEAVALDTRSVNGSIKVESAREFFDARTTNGNIKIGELDGALSTETTNGDVEVTLIESGAYSEHDIDIETLNGRVDLTLPRDFSMTVEIKVRSDNGSRRRYSIFSDFDVEIEEDVRRYDAVANGVIGDGKHKVSIRTVNGNVYLRRAR